MLLFSCQAVTGLLYLSYAFLAVAGRHLHVVHHLTVAWLLHSHALLTAAECRKCNLV